MTKRQVQEGLHETLMMLHEGNYEELVKSLEELVMLADHLKQVSWIELRKQ